MTNQCQCHDDDHRLAESRTLFDIIRDEESGTAYKNLVQRYSYSNTTNNHTSKSKSLRDRLCIRRSSSSDSSPPLSSSLSLSLSLSASSCSNPVPASDVPLPSNPKTLHRAQSSLPQTTDNSSHQISLLQRTTTHSSFQRTQSSLSSRSQHLLFPANPDDEPQGEEHQSQEAVVIPPDKQGEDAAVLPIAEEYQEDELVEKSYNDDEQQQQQQQLQMNADIEKSKNSNIFNNNEPPVKIMSLLDLLAETDRQAGLVGPTYLTTNDDDNDEEEGEEDQVAEEEEEGGECVCCVCMVRHKGTAFIPCGHTFCRLCSRELWVSRGNCPLCNAYILEILDIF